MSECNKISEETRETKADIQKQMDKLNIYKADPRKVNFQPQRNSTKRDRDWLAQPLPEPDENSERMWRGEQRAVEKLEETFHQHSISLMSEEASNLTIQAQLTMELEKVSKLKANVTALYQEGERLGTGRILTRGTATS